MQQKIHFECDYTEGAHPRILERLVETNMEQTVGYGEDPYCQKAAELIQGLCKKEEAAVHFLVGGTQANLTVISALLRPHQAAVCVETGHINVHETGAIEAVGHKVISVPGKDGKLTAEDVARVHRLHWEDATHEHMPQPKLVYISNPTETGTIYTKAELEALQAVCDRCGLYLFLDGARLGYGLAAADNDLDLESIAENCDVFYIGGTKMGALVGEAVVICNPKLQEDFRYLIKQKGGMLAKGRLLGIQFFELLQDGLYFELGEHAVKLAQKLREGLLQAGYEMQDSTTNQQFVTVSDEELRKIEEKYCVSYIERAGENQNVIRLCTSWATTEENVEQFLRDAAHAREIKAAGAKYCDCPACEAVEAILEKKDLL